MCVLQTLQRREMLPILAGTGMPLNPSLISTLKGDLPSRMADPDFYRSGTANLQVHESCGKKDSLWYTHGV